MQERGAGLGRPCGCGGVEQDDAGLVVGGVFGEVGEHRRVGRGGLVDDEQVAGCSLPGAVVESLMQVVNTDSGVPNPGVGLDVIGGRCAPVDVPVGGVGGLAHGVERSGEFAAGLGSHNADGEGEFGDSGERCVGGVVGATGCDA